MGNNNFDITLPSIKRQFKGVFFTKKGEAFKKERHLIRMA